MQVRGVRPQLIALGCLPTSLGVKAQALLVATGPYTFRPPLPPALHCTGPHPALLGSDSPHIPLLRPLYWLLPPSGPLCPSPESSVSEAFLTTCQLDQLAALPFCTSYRSIGPRGIYYLSAPPGQDL